MNYEMRLPLQMSGVAVVKGGNGRKNHLTIFARISFYSVGNGNGKVKRNTVSKIWFIENG
jgi:hypothetical protein